MSSVLRFQSDAGAVSMICSGLRAPAIAAVTSGLLIWAIYVMHEEMPLPLGHPFKVLGNLSAALLGEGRKDESGDFTEGAGLAPGPIAKIKMTINAHQVLGNIFGAIDEVFGEPDGYSSEASREQGRAWADEAVELRKIAEGRHKDVESEPRTPFNETVCDHLGHATKGSQVGEEGVAELRQIAALCAAQGYGPDRIVIDPSVVRGLGYYTGPVFEAELTFEITDEKGRPRQFGSVAGGGRYDDLVKRFTGQAVPATGISIGVDRLLAALRAKGRVGGDSAGPVVVTVMDRDRMADYQAMAGELRAADIRAEVYLGNPKNFGNQMKYADRRNSPVAVIEGSDEKARGVVQVKDLILGAKIAENADLEEWQSRPSQYEVPRGDLVAKIREILAEHGLGG